MFLLLPSGAKLVVSPPVPDLECTVGTQHREVHGGTVTLAPSRRGGEGKGPEGDLEEEEGMSCTDMRGCSLDVLLTRSAGLVTKMSPFLQWTSSLEHQRYGKSWLQRYNLLSTRNLVQVSWISLQSTGYGRKIKCL